MRPIKNDIVRKIQSCYLRQEQRFDKWGAQGKLLAAREVLLQEQRTIPRSALAGLVNAAFPRTFSCRHRDSEPLPDQGAIALYFSDVRRALSREELAETDTECLALEETAERFCLSVEIVRALTRPKAPFPPSIG